MKEGTKYGLIGLFLGLGAIVLIILEISIVIIFRGTPESILIAYIIIAIAFIVAVVGLILSIKALRVIESSNLGIAGIVICSFMMFLLVLGLVIILMMG